MAAGISQEGRSRGGRFSGGIDGLRAGVGGGFVACLGAAVSLERSTAGAPATDPVGVHAGVAIGVQVGAAAAGAGVEAGVGIAEGGSYFGVAAGGGS
jgi:hypothetical protein